MIMNDNIFIDTNLLVYFTNEDSPFHNISVKIITEASKNNKLFISRQVLREYAVIMTREGIIEKPLSPEEVTDDIDLFQSIYNTLDENIDVTQNLNCLIKKYKLKGKRIHDANITAVMMSNDIKNLITFNTEDFKKFSEINLINVEDYK